MALYTGKGDAGTTKVIDSKERFSKASRLAEALGSLDELNSFIGLCKIKASSGQAARHSPMFRLRSDEMRTRSHFASSLDEIKSEDIDSESVRVNGKEVSVSYILHEVQENLFIVQAQVAGSDKKIVKKKVTQAERYINTIENIIPPIKGFTIAGATELSALLDVVRTIARRTERRVVLLHDTKERKLTKDTLAYMNRLSSLLFALARLASHQAGVKERTPTYR
ncbi:MAG: ATP:cob(I)alamin adenosyltransferase [Parcubacteria group bacterium]|nr:ATP:cob(I)alamin adenosyltransferase [Parcubacteria group bacterium]